jgi:oxaloacetate decarboxylase (Na+ extruding) subunit alpha
MVAAGPAPRGYDPKVSPIKDLIRKLSTKTDLSYVRISKPGFELELRGRT